MVLPVAPSRDGNSRAMSGDDLVVDCALYFKYVVKPYVVSERWRWKSCALCQTAVKGAHL